MKIVEHLRSHAELQGGKDALVWEAGALSYRAMLERVDDRAAELRGQGINPGGGVAITIAAEIDHFITSLALLALGTRQITLATFDTPEVRQDLLRRAAVTLVVDADGVHAVGSMSTAAQVAEELDGSLMLRTSGTTGRPSLIELPSSQFADQARGNPNYDSQRLLCLATVEHNNAKRHRLYCQIAGGTNVFRPIGELDVVSVCDRYGVSTLDVAPIHAASLAATLKGRPLRNVTVRISGSLVPAALRENVEHNVTPLLSVRFGATECGTISIAGPGTHGSDAPVGWPPPGVVIEVVDADGRSCAPGTTGEIRVRTPGMATSYLGNAEKSGLRFRDGWFWPGDVGRLRADGALIVEGRKDDMMILNGINIFPAEIEQVLESHPAVAAAAALPLESPAHGHIPVAAVELHHGATATVAELQAFARERLALRAPRRVIIMPSLPRGALGKILRREIAEAFRPGRTGND